MHLQASESALIAASVYQPVQDTNSPYIKFLTLQDFEAAFVSAKEVTLEFNFTMATDVNSYDTINSSVVREMYNVGTNAVPVNGGIKGF